MAAPINLQANLQLNPASINASARQVQQALGRITGQASEFQKSLDASTARVFAFGATTAVIAGVGTAFKKLVSTTITVQEELIKMNAILGASQAEFAKFRDVVFDAAKTTGQSFQTVAAGAQELARQGLNAAETSKRLEAAMILTRISGLGAEQSVKALTAAINGFQSAGLTAAEVTNKLVAVDTRFAVSAQDLAEGFSRAGSTAEDAGVSFDELLGLITAVEQKTARGGAVIGNAFKSIFTRLSRGDTIAELQDLGVQIEATQTGVEKLRALSNALERISDPTTASKIKELAGGVFQINVVSAALKDLGNEASIFGQATESSLKAGNDAFERNAQLSESLASQINSLVVTFTDLGEKIGSLTIAPLLQDITSLASKSAEFLAKALDPESAGGTFIKGLFGAIGKFLSGPALVIFGKAFFKIFSMVSKFAAEGFSSIMKMGTSSEKLKNIQSGIVDLLNTDKSIRAVINNQTLTQEQKAQAIVTAIQNQNKALREQRNLTLEIAQNVAKAGVTGYGDQGFKGKRTKGFAAGYDPFAAEEQEAMSLGASSDVNAYQTNLRGIGPAIVNDQEDIVNIGGKDAVIPRYAGGTGGKRGRPKGPPKELNGDNAYGMIVAESGSKSVAEHWVGQGEKGAINVTKKPQDNSIFKVSVPIYRLNEGKAESSMQKFSSKLDEKYSNMFAQDAAETARMISGGLPDPVRIAEIRDTLNKGSTKSALGSVFESGVAAILQEDDFRDFQKRAAGSLMDFSGSPLRRMVGSANPFGIADNTEGIEAKYSSALSNSAAEKIYKIRGKALTKEEKQGNKTLSKKVQQRRAHSYVGNYQPQGDKKWAARQKNMARGHIPKFAKGRLPRFAVGTGGSMGSIVGMTADQIDNLAKTFASAAMQAKSLAVTDKQLIEAERQAEISTRNLAKSYGIAEDSAQRLVAAQMDSVKTGEGRGRIGGAISKVKEKISGDGGMFAGLGLSVASQALDTFSAKLRESGNETGAQTAEVASSVTSMVAMGMQFGVVGAAAGALAGVFQAVGPQMLEIVDNILGTDFSRDEDQDEQDRVDNALDRGRRADLTAARKQAGQIVGDDRAFFKRGKDVGVEGMAKKTSAFNKEYGVQLKDYTAQIASANMVLKNSESSEEAKEAANQDLIDATLAVARQQKQMREIKNLADSRKRLVQVLDEEKRNAKKAMSSYSKMLNTQQLSSDAASTILGSMKGPAAASMAAQNATNQDILGVGMAKKDLMNAKAALAGSDPTDKQAQEELKEKIVSASQAFKEQVAQAASNMKARMNEITDRQKVVANEIEQTRTSMVRSSFSDLASSFTNPSQFDQQGFQDLSGQFKSAGSSQEKAQIAAEMQALLQGMPQILQDMALKNAGLSSRDMDRATLENSGMKLSDEDMNAALDKMQKERGSDKLADLSKEQETLKTEMGGLTEKFSEFKEKLDVAGIVTHIDKLAQGLEAANTDMQKFAEATTQSVSLAGRLTTATSKIDSVVQGNMEALEKMARQISALDTKIEAVTKTE